MALKLIGSRDQVAFTLTDNGSTWAAASASRVHWATVSSSSIDILPGRYKVETLGPSTVSAYSAVPWAKMGDLEIPTAYLEAHESGTRIYAKGGGTIIITRLA